MNEKVTNIFGGATVSQKPNEATIAFLEDLLERAKSGDVVGVAVSSLHWDQAASYAVVGSVGGYSMIGGLEMAKATVVEVNRGDE